jgi:hypothetical protein
MKALVVNALGRGFDLEDVDIAAPIGREVLVKTCKTRAMPAPSSVYIRSRRLRRPRTRPREPACRCT